MEIIDRIKELIADHLKDSGMELVDIIYRREQNGMVLRLLVDKAGGITINECEALNIFLSDTLDRGSLITERYTLEVSSPGLDRPLKTDRDYARSMGKVLEVTVYAPVDGRRAHEGTLVGMDSRNIVIESGGMSTVISRDVIARAVLKIEV